ncbi:histidinol-phosphate transaminase [bacterium]|nr:histidinol-phosphate transaminase [bacterium]
MSIEKKIRKAVLDAPAYHLKTEEGIKLNQNESPWDIPVHLKTEIIEKLLQTPWNRYPLGDIVPLKKKLAKLLNLWPDNLVFANGSNVLIQAIIMACAVNDKIMVLDPTFSVYELQGQLLGNTIIKYPLDENFEFDRDALIATVKKQKPKVLFIANPNAPTGNLYNLNMMRAIVEECPCLVVVDEAYYPFSGTTVINWVRQYDNLIVLRTFSKAFAMGGVRFGYLAADADIATQIEKCLLPFCISKLTAACVDTVLDHPEYVENYTSDICKERDRVVEEMKNIPGITVYPTKANFVLFKCEDSQTVFRRVLNEGVILRDVSNPTTLAKTLRVSIGTKEENNAFLSALKKAI